MTAEEAMSATATVLTPEFRLLAARSMLAVAQSGLSYYKNQARAREELRLASPPRCRLPNPSYLQGDEERYKKQIRFWTETIARLEAELASAHPE